MHTVNLILLVVSVVCLFLAAIGVGATRVNLLALGLLAFVLTFLLTTIT
jgi:hypothetical protein